MRHDDVLVLVRYRLEQANEALADAEFLLAGQRGPRSIVNRAYYAMFYAVLALLQSVGEVPSRHSSAIGIFDREFVLKGALAKEHSAWLHRAFELRQTTDYRVQELPTTAESRTLLEKATTFVGEIEQYLEREGYPPKQ